MQPFAQWNSSRDVWEVAGIEATGCLFCGHLAVFSETFTTSGSMRNGAAYERPTWGPRTAGSACSSSPEDDDLLGTPSARMWKGAGPAGGPTHHRNSARGLIEAQVLDLLPTPVASVANDGESPETWLARRELVKAKGINGMGMPLTIAAQLPPTTTAADSRASGGAEGSSNVTLTDAIVRGRGLLPTPRATEGTKGGPNQRGSSGDLMLPSAFQTLLPTPRTSDTNGPCHHGTGGPDLRTVAAELAPRKDSYASSPKAGPGENLQGVRQAIHQTQVREAPRGPDSLPLAGALQPVVREQEAGHSGGQPQVPGAPDQAEGGVRDVWGEVEAARPPQGPEPGEQFAVESASPVCELPPEAALGRGPREEARSETNWGPYEPAIRRWEMVLGRPSPPPTEANAKGNHRLSPAFCEFMMGVPAGWICDTDISRNEQLKAAGNGVVPQQAAAALRDMLAAFETQGVAA